LFGLLLDLIFGLIGERIVDTSSAENLKRVAQQLVQAREAKGISLEEISTKTFIPMRILKAIEAGETFKLPEPIFVQGFIKRYAKLVDLDGDTLAKEIPLSTQPVAVDLIKEVPRPPLVDVINKRVSLDAAPKPSSQSWVDPVQSSRSVDPAVNGGDNRSKTVLNPPVINGDTPNFYGSQSNASERPSWLWPAIGGAVLGLGFLGGAVALLKASQTAEVPNPSPKSAEKLTTQPSPQSSPKPSPVPSAASVPTVSPSPSPSAVPSSSPSSSPTPSPIATGPVNVAVSLNEASWMQVTVDGEVKFEGTLEKGSKQSWSGKKEVEISSGNAGAVMLVHNQTPAKAMGAAGQVETKKFSAKN
jgi:cytoskeleton protein RodZ